MYEILAVFVLCQTIIFALYILRSRLCVLPANLQVDEHALSNIDVIIASNDNPDTLSRCLESVTASGFKHITVCLDGVAIEEYTNLYSHFPQVSFLHTSQRIGKIPAQLKCLDSTSLEDILILDADIELFQEAIPIFVAGYYQTNVDFLCPYSIGKYTATPKVLKNIAECDRLLRQRIFRAGRDSWGLSNLSGYCMLAKRVKYLEIIDAHAVQDDVAATIKLIKLGFKVATCPITVCCELERTSITSYILQKIRWTAGNIQSLKYYPKLFKAAGLRNGILASSIFLLWYLMWWITAIVFMASIFQPWLLLPLFVEGVCLFYASYQMHHAVNIRHHWYIIYFFVWPFLSFLCLIMTPFYLGGLLDERFTRRKY